VPISHALPALKIDRSFYTLAHTQTEIFSFSFALFPIKQMVLKFSSAPHKAVPLATFPKRLILKQAKMFFESPASKSGSPPKMFLIKK
jgi:hypothetical protein